MVSNGSDRPPVIGITTYLDRARYGIWDTDAVLLDRTYVDRVRTAGGNPVMIPPIGDWRAETVDWLDGVVIAGGADIDPQRYGQAPHPATTVGDPLRDSAEFALVDAAIQLDLPVLAVCRGAQLLNVACGGTLHQHTPDVVETTIHQRAPGTFSRLDITVEPGSLMADEDGRGPTVTRSVTVACHHHQSIADLGDGLDAVAHAADGTIEAIRLAGATFIVGVQFHPEQLDELDLFGSLVEAARQHRSTTGTNPSSTMAQP